MKSAGTWYSPGTSPVFDISSMISMPHVCRFSHDLVDTAIITECGLIWHCRYCAADGSCIRIAESRRSWPECFRWDLALTIICEAWISILLFHQIPDRCAELRIPPRAFCSARTACILLIPLWLSPVNVLLHIRSYRFLLLHFKEDRQYHRCSLRLVVYIFSQILTYGRLHAVPVLHVLLHAFLQRFLRDPARVVYQSLVFSDVNESPRYYVRSRNDFCSQSCLWLRPRLSVPIRKAVVCL